MTSSLNFLLECAESLVQLRAWISIGRVSTSILSAAPRDPACRRHDHLSTGFVQRPGAGGTLHRRRGAILRSQLVRPETTTPPRTKRHDECGLLCDCSRKRLNERSRKDLRTPRPRKLCTSRWSQAGVAVDTLQLLLNLGQVECVAGTEAEGPGPVRCPAARPGDAADAHGAGPGCRWKAAGRGWVGEQAVLAGRVAGIVVAREAYQEVPQRCRQPAARPG